MRDVMPFSDDCAMPCAKLHVKAKPTMNDIVLSRKNTKSMPEARAAAEHLAQELNSSFGLRSRWQDDALHFERPGVNGELTISEEDVTLTVHLGFFLAALKPSIEREVHRYFDENFSG